MRVIWALCLSLMLCSAAWADTMGGGGGTTIPGGLPVGVSSGGTGLSTLTSGSYLKGNGTSPVTLQAAPIPVTDGGTGATSLSGHGAVIMNSGGTAQSVVAPSTSGNVLTSNGTDWTSAAASGGSSNAKTVGGLSVGVPTSVATESAITPYVPVGNATTIGTIRTFATSANKPFGIAPGPDGRMWYSLGNSYGKIAAITTAGVSTEYNVSSGIPTPQCGGICTGPDGNVYVAIIGTSSTYVLAQVTPTGSVTQYTLPAAATSICVGSDGAIWSISGSSTTVIRTTTAGVSTTFTAPYALIGVPENPTSLACGPDGRLYAMARNGQNVVAWTTAGVFTSYPVIYNSLITTCMVFASDGRVWFYDYNGAQVVGAMTTAGVETVYSLGTINTAGAAAGCDGNLYYADASSATIKQVAPHTGVVLSSISTANVINSIAAGVDGNMWYTDSTANTIGVIPLIKTLGDVSVSKVIGDVSITSGDVLVATAGKGISIKSGSNAKVGSGTLSGGTLTVSNTSVTANSLIVPVPTSTSVNSGTLAVTAQTAATSFVVTSSNSLDANTFKYVIFEAP